MMVFDLRCQHDHVFEAWFASGDAFAAQQAAGLVCCPLCDSSAITKAVMAPAVAAKSNSSSDRQRKSELARLAALQAEVESRCDYVGPAFATEARARHAAKVPADQPPPRGIVGETSIGEAMALIDDGIPIAPLPFRSRRTANA